MKLLADLGFIGQSLTNHFSSINLETTGFHFKHQALQIKPLESRCHYRDTRFVINMVRVKVQFQMV